MPASDEPLRLVFADPRNIDDPDLLHRYRGLLSAEECARHDRFRFPRDRHHFLVAHALVRTTLARATGRDAASLTFTIGERGRPELDLPDGEVSVRFNLSHTLGRVAVAVTASDDVGVDVERMRDVNLGVAERHFAPSEAASLRALPADQQEARFFAYWTLKEAYIKARGLGLALPLDGFAFDLDGDCGDGRMGFSVRADLGDSAEEWSFGLIDAGAEHRAAFAVRSGAGATVRWSASEVVPLAQERPIDLPVLATWNV